jgi:hypothetical protein
LEADEPRRQEELDMTQSLKIVATAMMTIAVIGSSVAQQNPKVDNLERFSAANFKALSKQNQERILLILHSTKLLAHQEDVSVLDGVPTRDILYDRGREVCKATCDENELSAQNACDGIMGSTAATACYVAAGAATIYCKDRC